ncbi:MAG: quinoprotein dehydrogenase-associated SoxYZ-like carrier [Pseudomonadota bacterium]
MRKQIALGGLALGFAISAAVAAPQTPLKDPLQSGNWSYSQEHVLDNPKNIRFDDRVIVKAPPSAEDSFNVPVLVDATALPNVKRIVLLVDYGPIPKILTYWPDQAEAKLSLRFKIDQATPVRAAVETHAGTWHVGSTYVDAAGGGCSAPAHAYASNDWEEKLGQVNGMVWPKSGRVRMVVDHPMDTGLADGIPVFIIKRLQVDDDTGKKLATIEMYEPVNEDPAFTLYFPKNQLKGSVRVHGRDNNGNEIDAVLRARLTQ